MLFDNAEETVEPTLGGRASSTPATKERFVFLKTKRLNETWSEGKGARYLYRKGPQGSTVYDTWKLIGEPLPKRGRA